MSTNQHKLQGLSEEEVVRNRQQYGENTLTPPKRESIWKLYLEKFKDPVIKVLLVAAILSLGISIIETGVQNASVFNPEMPLFDKILCDVPCSGLGVIAKKPDLRRKKAEDVERLPKTQF